MKNNLYISPSVEQNNNAFEIIEKIKQYTEINSIEQLYLINSPLIENKYRYEYENYVVIILSPKHKIIFINLWNDTDKFNEYYDEFIEDLTSISDKFSYKDYIGRPKEWKKEITIKEIYNTDTNIESLLEKYKLDASLFRKNELIISLLVWSINDIKKVWVKDPDTLLQKVKKNIILFDGDQTRFIYNKIDNKKCIYIQWLAWTGKTELLFHKLKDIYLNTDNTKIFFTCHNKILANDLKNRVPKFFDFMKVEKQIEWNKRLWVWSAWGAYSDKNSWFYSYLCDFYDVPFLGYSKNNSYKVIFWIILDKVKENIRKNQFNYAFDYLLVDESQDFPDVFFELCELITKEKVYVAWDIFQNIFITNIGEKVINSDFILNKCYRTELKTLMFAHSIWMWLFEEKKLNWLTDKEWEVSWYTIKRNNNEISLYREPLRRFEGVPIENSMNIEILDNPFIQILNIIEELKNENTDIIPDDIAIIFLDGEKVIYKFIDNLEFEIIDKLWWQVNKWYETKERQKDKIFISNKNNVKWLEFPFVICITIQINGNYFHRNSLYTMLTRSFLKSYLLVLADNYFLQANKKWLEIINECNCIKTIEPSVEEIKEIKSTVLKVKNSKSLREVMDKIFSDLKIIKEDSKKKLAQLTNEAFKDKEWEEEDILGFIQYNMNYF